MVGRPKLYITDEEKKAIRKQRNHEYYVNRYIKVESPKKRGRKLLPTCETCGSKLKTNKMN